MGPPRAVRDKTFKVLAAWMPDCPEKPWHNASRVERGAGWWCELDGWFWLVGYDTRWCRAREAGGARPWRFFDDWEAVHTALDQLLGGRRRVHHCGSAWLRP